MSKDLLPADPEGDFDEEDPPGWGRKFLTLATALVTIVVVWTMVAAFVLIDPKEAVVVTPVVDHYPEDRKEAIKQAREAWERFVEAPGFSSRVAEVRDSDRVRLMMEDYHVDRRHPFPTMNQMSEGQPVNVGGRRMVLFQVLGFDGLTYPVAVEWSDQRFRVDWESLSAYGTMDWIELLERKPEETQTMRIFLAELSDRWKPPAESTTRWRFSRMEHRDSADSVVIGATEPLAREIEEMVGGKRVPVTVELRWNDGIEQFEIVRMVAWTWSN